MTIKNFQCVIYYINAEPVIDEDPKITAYQGEIVGGLVLLPGHIPTVQDVEFMSKDVPKFKDGGSVLVNAVCLN